MLRVELKGFDRSLESAIGGCEREEITMGKTKEMREKKDKG